MKEIKTACLNITKDMTPSEGMKRMITRAVEKHYGVGAYRMGMKHDKYTDMYDFIVFAVKDGSKFCEFRGYVGCLGQVVITWKDGRHLDIKEFEEVF